MPASFMRLGLAFLAVLCFGCAGGMRGSSGPGYAFPDASRALDLAPAGPAVEVRGQDVFRVLGDRAPTYLAFGLVAERADGAGMLILIRFDSASAARTAADAATAAIGRRWSQWAVAHNGRFLLTFAKRGGQCSADDLDQTDALVRRIAAANP